MVRKILDDIIRVLRGKNGSVFLIVGALIFAWFFMRILGPLLWLLIVGALVYFIFKYLENKNNI